MPIADHSIAAKVKALLVRRGVDLRDASFGVTNGVVTITGSLCSSRMVTGAGMGAVVQEVVLARWLSRQIKRVDGVRDVIFRLDHVMNAQLGN